MSNEDDSALEEQILSRFLDGIEDNPEISDELTGLIKDKSAEDDFGGRDQLKAQILEVKETDED